MDCRPGRVEGETMSKRAVLYARVSGDDRQNATSSIDGQLDLCRQYGVKNSYQIIAELAEDDRRPTSGASWDLPQLNKALDMARAGDYDVLITRELDRLARNLAKQLVLEEQLQGYGVEVEYVYGDYANTPEGQLNKQIRAVIAEYEREKINQRMVGGRRRKVAGGEVIVHGNPPYGYRLAEIDGRAMLEIVEEMAQVIRLIFALFVDDCLGTVAIAKRLNGLGIAAPSVAKNTAAPQASRGWSHSAVNRVIHNETYAGVWRYGKRHTTARQVHPDDYQIAVSVPAIVGRDIFERAQEQRRRNIKNSKRNTKGQYLLARRCFCGECNTPMTVAAHKWGKAAYNYYRCNVPNTQTTHYVNRSCNMRTHFRIEHWDTIVWQEIKSFLGNPDNIETGAQRYRQEQETSRMPLRNRLKTTDTLLARKQRELGRLIDLYVAGDFDRDMLLDRKQRLETEIQSLSTEGDALREELTQGLTNEQVMELVAFSRQVAEGLDKADSDFDLRRRIIEYLNVRVVLAVEEGQQVAYLHCELGHDARLSKTPNARPAESSFPQRGLESLANSRGVEEGSYMSIDKHNTGCRRS